MSVCNLGDSGLYVLSSSPSDGRARIVGRTPEQIEGFNMPSQVGFDETGDIHATSLGPAPWSLPGHTLHPTHAVLLATDGVIDNIFPDHIERLCNNYLSRPPHIVAADVATAAFNASHSDADTPWGQYVKKSFGSRASKEDMLGKPDDITTMFIRFQKAASN